jgi:hypothetical protein
MAVKPRAKGAAKAKAPAKGGAQAALASYHRAGLSDEQLARAADLAADRIGAIRKGAGGRVPARVEHLVRAGLEQVRRIVEQQEAIDYLAEVGLKRLDLTHAVGATPNALTMWDRGNETRVNVVGGARRERLLGIARRARVEVERGRSLEDDKVLRRVLGVERPPARSAGMRSGEESERLQGEMRERGYWPPKKRAAKLAELVRKAGGQKNRVADLLNISRGFLYKLLDPASSVLMTSDLIDLAERLREEGVGDGAALKERFLAAMTTLLGEERVETGFPLGGRGVGELLERLQPVVGLTPHSIRKWFPPYDKAFWEKRHLSLDQVERFERAAKKLKRITPGGKGSVKKGSSKKGAVKRR